MHNAVDALVQRHLYPTRISREDRSYSEAKILGKSIKGASTQASELISLTVKQTAFSRRSHDRRTEALSNANVLRIPKVPPLLFFACFRRSSFW